MKIISEFFSDNDYRKAIVMLNEDKECSNEVYTIRLVDVFGSISYTTAPTLEKAEDLAEDYVL
jgi:hypothetical protein